MGSAVSESHPFCVVDDLNLYLMGLICTEPVVLTLLEVFWRHCCSVQSVVWFSIQ